MKKIALLLLLSGVISASKGQDTVKVVHEEYTSIFAQSAHIPVVVEYMLHADEVQCAANIKVERSNNFKADPKLAGTGLKKDYEGSGYDCGHNMSAQDNACSDLGMNECFYYTNMFPQTPKLNRGVWKSLEEHERSLARTYDSVFVVVGSYGVSKKIGPDGVVVPAWCWKAIYIPGLKEWRVYSFPNDMGHDFGDKANYENFKAPLQQQAWIQYCIKKFTGYKY